VSVGYATDKNQVDLISGQISRQIEQWAPDAIKFKAWLDTMPDEDLQAAPFNYTADEVALLKSAMADLAELANVYLGKATVEAARDFGQFSRRLAGLYL
jgi:hypothetical protein